MVQWFKPEAGWPKRTRRASQNKPFVRARLETKLRRDRAHRGSCAETGKYWDQEPVQSSVGAVPGTWLVREEEGKLAQIKDKQWSLALGELIKTR